MSIKNFFTAFFDSFSDVDTRFELNNEIENNLIEEYYFNAFKGKDKFSAVILQTFDETPGDQTQQTQNAQHIACKVRPLDIHDFILPEPCDAKTRQGQANIIDLHPTAFSSFMGSPSSVKVGDVVECYFEEQGPEFHGKQRKIRFNRSIIFEQGGKYKYDCLKNFGSTFASTRGSFINNVVASVLGESVDNLDYANISATGHDGYTPVTAKTIADKDLKCQLFPWVKGKRRDETAWCRTGKPSGKRWDNIGTSNFHKIEYDTKNNYRSAQPPNDPNFFRFLKKAYGIERVVTLNAAKRKKAVEAAGLEYVRAPMGSTPPTKKQWKKIEAFLEKGNTLIHCTHGADRTGAIAAAWQDVRYNLSTHKAYQLSLSYGFKPKGYQYKKNGVPIGKKDVNGDLRRWMLDGWR